jgi:hypothetical protein
VIDTLFTVETRLIAAITGSIMLAAMLVSMWRVWRRRHARAKLQQTIRKLGLDAVQDALVPDGMGGWLHIDFMLLTPNGVLLVELHDIAGNVFGGDQMTLWTVIDGPRRSTFGNPQGPMYDRVAAVKALTNELQVQGRLVFGRRARFPKGLPRWTTTFDSLRAEFPLLDSKTRTDLLAQSRDEWTALRASMETSNAMRPSRSFLHDVFFE